MILNIIIRLKVINWVLIWKGLIFYLTKFGILLTHRLSSWTNMWVLGLHHSLLNRLCVPINCLFTSNTKVHVYLMELYSRTTCQFHTEYGTALLLVVLQFLFPSLSNTVRNQFSYYKSYSHSMTSHLSRTTGWLNEKLFQLLTINCTHVV
jgi:hypothetical protein